MGGKNKPGPPIQLKSVITSQTHKKIRGRRLRPVLTRTCWTGKWGIFWNKQFYQVLTIFL